jgi:hypothetical protein
LKPANGAVGVPWRRGEEEPIPLFMDVHENVPEGTTAHDVAQAHAADVATQEKYGVNYMKYWFNDDERKIFCLVEARRPSRRTPSTARPTDWWPTRSSRSRRGPERQGQASGPGRSRPGEAHCEGPSLRSGSLHDGVSPTPGGAAPASERVGGRVYTARW